MNEDYINKLLQIVAELEEMATETLSNSNVMNEIEIMNKIKYLAGYVEALKAKLV